jgi:large subunit ribosomal protein L13
VRTFSPKPGDIDRAWHVIDASDVVLGRLAAQSAQLLRGKHKPTYAPHVDTGDFVVVVNASKLAIDPKKATDKLYHRHTGYPGGIRTQSLERMMERNAEQVVRQAVKRMLPKGPLGRQMLRKLKIYNGPTHPHQAQQPETYPLPDRARARTNA